MREKLKENRGGTLVLSAFILFTVLIISLGVIRLMQFHALVEHLTTTAAHVLDVYTSDEGSKRAASFKSGTTYTVRLDTETYVQLLAGELGIDRNLTGYKAGQIEFQITDVKLTYSTNRRIDSSAAMHIRVPLYLGGAEVAALDSDYTVRTKYQEVP